MVGQPNFIARPMDVRVIINGLISAGIAIAILLGLITWIEPCATAENNTGYGIEPYSFWRHDIIF